VANSEAAATGLSASRTATASVSSTLLRLPISLCLQILDCRFSLGGRYIIFQVFQGTFGTGEANPGNKEQRRSG
jgi:hypothetical protein